MHTRSPWLEALKRFTQSTEPSRAFLCLDLDGTALLEDQGKVFISSSVEKAVKAIHDLNIPLVLNTLRFPLSVINTVGHAWYEIADAPILTVLLNGSVLGYIKCDYDELHYEEIAAYPLSPPELESVLQGLTELEKAGVKDLLLFFYPRDWQEGESLWTPDAERIPGLKRKYISASRVLSGNVHELKQVLFQREICMLSLLVDRAQDTLMAYQHGKRHSFFTAKGVDKASGLREMGARLNRTPAHALGAGDTEMDTFLDEVGLAVIVGTAALSFRGKQDTIRVATPVELGELMLNYADLVGRRA